MSHFSLGGGGVIDEVGVGWGNIIKEKFMYDTGSKPIQSCYDATRDSLLITHTNQSVNLYL